MYQRRGPWWPIPQTRRRSWAWWLSAWQNWPTKSTFPGVNNRFGGLPTYRSLYSYLVHTYWPSSSHRACFLPPASEREREKEREIRRCCCSIRARSCTSPPFPPRPAGLGWPRCNRLGCFLMVTSFFDSSSLVWFGPPNSLYTQHKFFSLSCSSSDVSRHNGCQSPS
jgi:hypothetical protein